MIPPVSMISQASKYLWWRRYGSWQAEVRKAFKEYRLTRKPCMISEPKTAKRITPIMINRWM